MQKNRNLKIIAFCGIAVVLNVVLGNTIAALEIPFLFLDTLGTIFIAVNFGMSYGILTGSCTNLLIGVLYSPLALPFALVNMTVAITVAFVARKSFNYQKALVAGILAALLGSLVSTPLRLILFGGMSGTLTNITIATIRSTGQSLVSATYWGAVLDSIFDKTFCCLLIVWFNKLPQLKKFLT